MTPLAQHILATALSSCPVTPRTEIKQASYETFKVERIRSAYNSIIRKSEAISKTTANADLEFPLLFSAAGLAKIRLPRLDYNAIIRRDESDAWYKQVRDREAIETWTGVPFARDASEVKNAVYRKASLNSLNVRASELSWRIQEALSDNVFPVFWTLTVDPDHEYVISRGRSEFYNFVKMVRRRFGDFEYCCVVERGALGRLHYHSLFLFSDLSQCTDPNFGRPDGNRAEIPELRGLWPYGLSNPVAVRYSPTDVFGRLGWRWPRGRQTGAPQAVALYMAKYLTKATDEVNGCRTKMSRGFGLKRLAQMNQSEALLILLGSPEMFLSRLTWASRPPKSTMKLFAARKLFGHTHRLPLPKTRTGSTVQAAKMLALAKSTPMNAGDSINRGAGFKDCLDPYRQPMQPLHIGGMS